MVHKIKDFVQNTEISFKTADADKGGIFLSENSEIYISKAEIDKQKEFIKKIKKINDEFEKNTGMRKKAFVETYGCQQNENDSERIRGVLEQSGYEFTSDRETADFILYNTCAVRENAELKVFGNLGALKHYKKRNPNLVIAVCGCMIQQEHIATAVKQKYRHVDLIFGTHVLYKFAQMLYNVLDSHRKVLEIPSSNGQIAEDMPIVRDGGGIKAWVSIMYGCNNFCAYCIVPYVRGRERCRRPENIIGEIEKLALEGYQEITLLGQNVNSYGNNADFGVDFPDLLSMVCKIEGIARVRFMTSHPKDISDKLIDTIAKEDKLCKSIHLPFQAGNDRVLKEMNRRYTKQDYLEKISKVRTKIPEISLSTDIIVGFPTETDDEFSDTIDVVKKARFDIVYSFIYSKRKGTPAAELEELFTREDKQKRFNILMETQNAISREINENCVGKVYDVLVEGESKTDKSVMTGRTDTNKIINFPGTAEVIGKIVNVKVVDAHTWSLIGEIIEK